jgi:outer membrane protein TolC
MAAEKFKPRLDVNYSYLWGGFNVPATPEINARTWDNSAKFGLDYKIPILFRNERAKWQLARLKIRETELERTQLNRDIQNQIEATYNELSTQERLKTVQDQIVVNNTKLRDAELRRFENGESSLFLINTRDVTLVNSRLKLFEIKAKYAKNLIQLQWAAGTVEVVAAE